MNHIEEITQRINSHPLSAVSREAEVQARSRNHLEQANEIEEMVHDTHKSFTSFSTNNSPVLIPEEETVIVTEEDEIFRSLNESPLSASIRYTPQQVLHIPSMARFFPPSPTSPSTSFLRTESRGSIESSSSLSTTPNLLTPRHSFRSSNSSFRCVSPSDDIMASRLVDSPTLLLRKKQKEASNIQGNNTL